MQQIYPAIRSMDEQVESGLCNRGLVLEHGQQAYRLSAGTTDSLYVFQSSVLVYVLTVNLRLSYVALDVYMGKEEEPLDSVFLQSDSAIAECLGARWQSMSVSTMATRLINQFA